MIFVVVLVVVPKDQSWLVVEVVFELTDDTAHSHHVIRLQKSVFSARLMPLGNPFQR